MSKYSDRIVDVSEKNNSLTIIYDWVEPNSKVFDVGCDEGYFANTLVQKKGCKVWGLEIVEESAKKAEQFCEHVWVNDLNADAPFQGVGEKFDYIVFADVLEHINNPSFVLKEASKLLSRKGRILVSIPNIAHISMRLELLNGTFANEKTGIMDDTHLHYFTFQSFAEVIQNSGLGIVETSQVLRDVPLEIVEQGLNRVGLPMTQEFIEVAKSKAAQSYQLLFNISKGITKEKYTEEEIFKPMTIADDSVNLLKRKISILEEDLKSLTQKLENKPNIKRKLARKFKDIFLIFKKNS